MNEFQLPVVLVIIFSCIISLLINKFLLNFNYFIPTKNQNQEIRLSNLKIPTFGGIAMSIAFLISIRLLGKADFDIIQIAIYAVLITFIGFIDDLYNLNWKVKLFTIHCNWRTNICPENIFERGGTFKCKFK